MGEEEKKPQEKKMEEKKPEEATKPEEKKEEQPKAEKPSEEKKEEKKAEESKKSPAPALPQEIVLRVYMHCEGCAKKVRRCLKGFEGVEDVQTDYRSHKVVVKGQKADPMKVLERVQKKSHREVELLSPVPAPPPAEEPKKAEVEEAPKPEEKKEEPQVTTVLLKVHMHCEACAQEIKRRILRMKGVDNVEPDLKSSQVSVKGIFDPPKLLEYLYKRTGKHAMIVMQELEKKEEEKKADAGSDKEEKKGVSKEAPSAAAGAEGEEEEAAAKVVELKKNEFYYYYPQNDEIYSQWYPAEEFVYQSYPPQMFSDENPNACSVM